MHETKCVRQLVDHGSNVPLLGVLVQPKFLRPAIAPEIRLSTDVRIGGFCEYNAIARWGWDLLEPDFCEFVIVLDGLENALPVSKIWR